MSGYVSEFGVLRPPGRVVFGEGMLRALPEIVADYGRNVLICTDPVICRLAEVESVMHRIKSLSTTMVVYRDTRPELPKSCVQECLDQLAGTRPDVIVGLGGGSSMDLAKLVSLALGTSSDLSAFYGENLVYGPVLPVIAVPTTAGTGSEVTPVAVLDDESRTLKVGISSPRIIPRVAVVDPLLTHSCPTGLTVSSAADAMTHAIEAFTSIRRAATPAIERERVFVGKNIMSDFYALRAIELISRNIARVAKDGSDARARRDVMLGSLLAGLAFGVAGTGAAHAIQYPVGALTKTPHGLGVAVLMPFVMAFNRCECMASFAQIASAMGREQGTEAARANAAVELVSSLFLSVGIPENLAGLGVGKDSLDWIGEQSMLAKRLVDNNPRKLSPQGVGEIIANAWSGDLPQL